MNSLQIVINKEGYEISNQADSRSLVSNIRRMDEAMSIFHELTSSYSHPPESTLLPRNEWSVIPGVLAVN
ncbi:MAG: hypothetical protein HQL72_06115 [Magnetococcales bacterium]|nr:hypothetical protein [Magnetococcales bacterium]